MTNLTWWKISVKVSSLLHKEEVTACKAVKQLHSSQPTLMYRTLPSWVQGFTFVSVKIAWFPVTHSFSVLESLWKSSLPLTSTLHYGVVLLLMMMILSVTRHQLDFKVFSISLLSLMGKEFFIHLGIHSAYSCLTTFISTVLLDTLYKNGATAKVDIHSHLQSQSVSISCLVWGVAYRRTCSIIFIDTDASLNNNSCPQFSWLSKWE